MNRLSRISEQELSSNDKKIIFLVFFCVLTVAAPLLLDDQGVFVNDEGIYALMARSFAESGSLAIWNGYEEFPSPAFVLPHILIHEGRLVPQYPSLTAVLSYPFYRMAGFAGLLILNAIAYVATVGVCFLTARALFRDMALALNACLILVFATYSWEYSQAVWPHALSMLFVATSVYFAVAYGYFAWTGGMSLNLRYFVPILPFTSILAAFAWREITDGLSDSQRRNSIVAGALAGGLYLALILLGPLLVWEPWTLGQQEAIFLSLPLGIAAMALALVLGIYGQTRRQGAERLCRHPGRGSGVVGHGHLQPRLSAFLRPAQGPGRAEPKPGARCARRFRRGHDHRASILRPSDRSPGQNRAAGAR